MSESKDYPVAEINDNQLQKIKGLEKDLRNETNENIVLIAYDEEQLR
ncbi:hypothetical protein [Peribacillus cavernae]|nr:hypothetical protein [Peribacillus cavernae]MDQ0221431.1 hypothetical protein [Peribacillus cavernae]